MAKQVITTTQLTDDIDGTTAERTVAFGYDGDNYEIELSKKNIKALEKALEPYIQNARRVRIAGQRGPGRGRRGTPASVDRAAKRNELAQIREWAQNNGFEVSERGRIARHIVEAYEAAHAA